ncbi:hypothetical protein C0W28_07470 [Photobacterium kishitanii]|nr:hypothetical protein C0W28_07470 [Photobacterium kishitanii]
MSFSLNLLFFVRILESSNPRILESSNPRILESSNPRILESSNPRILESLSYSRSWSGLNSRCE